MLINLIKLMLSRNAKNHLHLTFPVIIINIQLFLCYFKLVPPAMFISIPLHLIGSRLHAYTIIHIAGNLFNLATVALHYMLGKRNRKLPSHHYTFLLYLHCNHVLVDRVSFSWLTQCFYLKWSVAHLIWQAHSVLVLHWVPYYSWAQGEWVLMVYSVSMLQYQWIRLHESHIC